MLNRYTLILSWDTINGYTWLPLKVKLWHLGDLDELKDIVKSYYLETRGAAANLSKGWESNGESADEATLFYTVDIYNPENDPRIESILVKLENFIDEL